MRVDQRRGGAVESQLALPACYTLRQTSEMRFVMSYTIQDFWIPRLAGIVPTTLEPVLPGWSFERSRNPSFVEADLHLRSGLGEPDTPVWLVAAPGAVGKSTLAKEISARTGAAYLDLGMANTVAGNYLTGGLFRNDLLTSWQQGRMTVLIDALDEARLRVTQQSFEDFLTDLEQLARQRSLPVALFGRVGIVEEAWLVLCEHGMNCPVFDIDFFDAGRAEQFVMAALRRLANEPRYSRLRNGLSAHRANYLTASASWLETLRVASASDGARFAGYAPVLEAVAAVLAGATNPAKSDESSQEAMREDVLQQLTDQILNREATKLRDQLSDVVPGSIRNELYSPDEQLDRLASIILGTPAPVLAAPLPPQYSARYDAAVKSFFPTHPFLDGAGRQPSGAVFSAVVSAYALASPTREVVAAAEKQTGNGPQSPNPFLIDFYLEYAKRRWGENPIVPPEHVGLLYDSIRARASAEDIVRLTVEGDEDAEQADVEIQISRTGARDSDRTLRLSCVRLIPHPCVHNNSPPLSAFECYCVFTSLAIALG